MKALYQIVLLLMNWNFALSFIATVDMLLNNVLHLRNSFDEKLKEGFKNLALNLIASWHVLCLATRTERLTKGEFRGLQEKRMSCPAFCSLWGLTFLTAPYTSPSDTWERNICYASIERESSHLLVYSYVLLFREAVMVVIPLSSHVSN